MHVRTGRGLVRPFVGLAIFCLATLPLGAAQAAPSVWTVVPVNVSETSPGLASVSCTLPSWCVGVGSQQASGSASVSQTLVELWDGSTWSMVASPDEGTNDPNVLQSVSCSSQKSCVAVGYWCSVDGCLENQSLVEVWDGTTWSVVSSPDPGSRNQLNSVSCTSARTCTAVGGYCPDPGCPNGSYSQSLVETWDGTTVSLVSSPNPASGDNILNSVSCITKAKCQAVGFDDNGADFGTLVEAWNGKVWSAVPSPNEGTDNLLLGVSCVSTKSCEAVGWLDNGLDASPQQSLAESWNGSTWSVVPSVSPSTDSDLLNSVSCTSATHCVAVGVYLTGPEGPAPMQVWNGTAWSEMSGSIPNPNGSYDGLSCTSRDRCVVLGVERLAR
jgi:hypothetical protein